MAISEKKMQIVIDNYFKSECDVNTSIRQAFEKGFRIGVMKGQCSQENKGEWLHPYSSDIACECSVCHIQMPITDNFHYCPNCGADMRGE